MNPETKRPANGNVGVTITKFGGALVSRTDTNALVEVDPVDLRPKPMFTYTTLFPEAKVGLHHAIYDSYMLCFGSPW